MNSLAVWYDNRFSGDAKVELHINVCTIKDYTEYIEFGVLLDSYKLEYGSFYLSVPFEISKNNFNDLSDELYDSTLISALFNETLSTEDKNKYFTVKSGSTIKFRVLSIHKENDLDFTHENGHTKIKISISDELTNNGATNTTIYMRFRINKIGKIFQKISTNRMFLDGYKEEKGIFEVNVNMKRKLPSEISQNLKKNMKISMINVFFLSDYTTDIIFESKDRKSARILENHIWDEYIGYKDLKIEKVVAYQWKSGKDITNVKDFNIFVKTLIREKTWGSWLLVMLFILFLGILGGVGGNAITAKYFNGFASLIEKADKGEIK